MRFWVQALQGEEGVCHAHQGDVVVPATEGAPLEVVEPERVLELAVVELDAPAQLGEAHEVCERRLRGQVGQPVLSSGQLAAAEAAETETPIGQLPTLPRVPEYWRATPTE